ncbi:hypothetical protein Tco_1319673 [Tanacetum coccineum]
MDAPTIPVSADSSKGNFKDDIDIGLDVAHPVPVAADVFPSEEMSTLRFRMGIAEAENASLRSKIRTMEAIETVTGSQERKTRRSMGLLLSLSSCGLGPSLCSLLKACSFVLCDLDFEPLTLSLTSMPSCDLESLTRILILCLILKASN